MSYAHLISNEASRQQVFDESVKPKENKKTRNSNCDPSEIPDSSLPAHLKMQILYRYWITISMEKQGFETLSGYDNFVYALKAK